MFEATALREQEKGVYDKFMAESSTNLAALTKAIAAVERGMFGCLQTRSASALRSLLAPSKDVMVTDRQDLASLSAKEGEKYAPQSGEITGILKTIKDEMFAEEQQTMASEAAAVKSYEELMAAKNIEAAALSKAIDQKLERISTLGVKIAEMKNDLGDSAQSLDEDKRFPPCDSSWDLNPIGAPRQLVGLVPVINRTKGSLGCAWLSGAFVCVVQLHVLVCTAFQQHLRQHVSGVTG